VTRVIRGLAVAAFSVLPLRLHAQGECFPPASSNEAKTFAILSVPLAFTGARAPAANPRGWAIGLEVASLPGVDDETARPTYCRPGKGPENTDPIPMVVRPRVAVAVAGFLLEGSWIPPVRVHGVRAGIVGLAVARPFAVTRTVTLGVRLHTVLGGLNAPVTCDASALEDFGSECFGGTLSDDRWNPGVSGVEAVIGTGTSIRPHAGVGYTMLRPRFQVNFTNAAGDTDRRRVEVDLERAAIFAGVSGPVAGLRVTLEAYATVGDAMTARLVVRSP
jgi:hypothetical protein